MMLIAVSKLSTATACDCKILTCAATRFVANLPPSLAQVRTDTHRRLISSLATHRSLLCFTGRHSVALHVY